MTAEFINAMRAAGLEPPSIIEPGKLHRFPGLGKKNGNTAGWCRLFPDGLGGVYGDWSTEFSEHWQAERAKAYSPAERAAFQRQVEESRAQAKADRETRQREAATKAAEIWESATPASDDYTYLTAKRVQANGLRIHENKLVIPLRDVGGNLHTLQFIDADGGKRYLSGGAVSGNHWTLGKLTPDTPFIYLCEGVATAGSLYQAMGGCAVAAMSSGNLKAVAEALHAKYPGARIIVCGDDDIKTSGNPGVKAGGEAAKTAGGIVAVPQFPEPRDDKATDFCDLAQLSGLETVKNQIDDLLAAVDQFESAPPQDGQNHSRADDQRIIAELAALPPLDYDRKRSEAAKQLSVRATTLDKLVFEKRENISAANEAGDHVVESLEPWKTTVDGRELANQIAKTVCAHVTLPPGAATAVTLFAVGSYCMDAWRVWPKLLITSPEKRCGKSTLLEALEGFCHRPLLTSGITASSLFRCIQEWSPSLLIDEADTFAKDNDELNGVINAGHTKRTATVIRSEKDGDSFKPKKFSVWCPQIIAGIKSQRDTLHDRSIHIQMRRKLPGESVVKMPVDFFERQETTRRQCMRWAADNLRQLKAAKPTVPNYGNDRAEDNWTPLFSIAYLIGGQWPERVLKAYETLTAGSGDDDSIGPMILADIRAIFAARGTDRIWSDDLVNDLVAMEERPWCEWKCGKPLTKNSLGRLLNPFRISSGTVRFGPDTKRGYKRKNFEDVWQRYLISSETPIQSDTMTQTSQGAGFSPISKRHTDEVCHFENPLKASNGAGCVTVSLQKGGNGSKGGNGYPPGLFDAATTACSGLKITAGEFISQLESEDYPDIINNPAVARSTAQSMAARK